MARLEAKASFEGGFMELSKMRRASLYELEEIFNKYSTMDDGKERWLTHNTQIPFLFIRTGVSYIDALYRVSHYQIFPFRLTLFEQ